MTRQPRIWWRKWMSEAPALPRLPLEPEIEPRFALLINPFYPKDPHASFGKHVLTPTLALTSIAGSTPPSWRVTYWDENLLQGPPPSEPFPQVVGISVHLTFAQRAFELARWFSDRGSIIVLGGLHVLSCPDECAPHADALVTGEGVQAWPEVLADVEIGNLKPRKRWHPARHRIAPAAPPAEMHETPRTISLQPDQPRRYVGSFRKPYREDPSPRRSILARKSFLTTASLIATRGCHNRCGFCYLATDGLHMPYHTLAPEQVVEQFVADDQPYAVFVDNNLGSKPEYLRQLCRALRPLDKTWSAAVSLDVSDDPSTIREMALAGCMGVFIGFESLSDGNLRDAGKRSPRADDYARRVELFHRNGIQVNGSFVLGFDQDGPDVFEKTVSWIEANRMECATFHILTPYPGTPLFKQMQAEDRLLHTDWSKYDTSHVVFKPAKMTIDELADGYAWCYERLFSHRSIWRRRPRDWSAVPGYLGMSYLYKRCNWLWPLLIRYRMVHRVWHPLIELTRRRHVKFRRRLALEPQESMVASPSMFVSASV